MGKFYGWFQYHYTNWYDWYDLYLRSIDADHPIQGSSPEWCLHGGQFGSRNSNSKSDFGWRSSYRRDDHLQRQHERLINIGRSYGQRNQMAKFGSTVQHLE